MLSRSTSTRNEKDRKDAFKAELAKSLLGWYPGRIIGLFHVAREYELGNHGKAGGYVFLIVGKMGMYLLRVTRAHDHARLEVNLQITDHTATALGNQDTERLDTSDALMHCGDAFVLVIFGMAVPQIAWIHYPTLAIKVARCGVDLFRALNHDPERRSYQTANAVSHYLGWADVAATAVDGVTAVRSIYNLNKATVHTIEELSKQNFKIADLLLVKLPSIVLDSDNLIHSSNGVDSSAALEIVAEELVNPGRPRTRFPEHSVYDLSEWFRRPTGVSDWMRNMGQLP